MAGVSFRDVLEKVAKTLTAVRAKWCLCGGIAANYYGSPRATYDLDIMVLLDEHGSEQLAGALRIKKKEFKKLLKVSNRYFWHIDSWRVDFWFPRGEYERNILKRKKRAKIDNLNVWLISPEDLIIQKLGILRPRDVEDITAVIKINRKINWEYLTNWCSILNLKTELKELKKKLRIKQRKGQSGD